MSETSEDQNSREGQSAPPAVAAPSASVDRRLFFVASGVAGMLALMLVALVVWNRFTLHRLDQTAQAERVQMTMDRQKALDTQGREILRLAGLPFGWAVRAEVLKENLQQVDDYFRRFIREPGVESIVFVDRMGKIAVATDRKLEGQAASKFASKALLDAVEPAFEENPPGIRMAIPVMGFDARVGVLILDYSLPGFSSTTTASPPVPPQP